MKQKTPIAIVVLGILILYVAAITIPISTTTKDIYISATINQPFPSPLPTNAKFVGVKVNSVPSTIIQSPLSPADIITSGKIKVIASTDTRSNTILIDNILLGTSTNMQMVIRNVPIGENKVTLKLYDNENLIQTYEVTLK